MVGDSTHGNGKRSISISPQIQYTGARDLKNGNLKNCYFKIVS